MVAAMRSAWVVVISLLGCGPKPTTPVGVTRPRQQPQPAQPQARMTYAPPWTPDARPAATLDTTSDLPIDPAKPMPKESLSSDARLELGKPASALIDGRADIFSSNLAAPHPGRGGRLPARITLVSDGGYITFSAVKGKVGCAGAGIQAGPDGGSCAGGNTDILAANGIAGIIDHDKTQFLVGVFLGNANPVRPAARLDFSDAARGSSFAELSPILGQTFFIGDGMTPSGLQQRFVIPPRATRLYLGFADAFSFQGPPGAYSDNSGGLTVTLTQAK
jgi:hypothetical protein